jgi:hypothetical protein
MDRKHIMTYSLAARQRNINKQLYDQPLLSNGLMATVRYTGTAFLRALSDTTTRKLFYKEF